MKKHVVVLFSIFSVSTIYSQEVVSTQGDSYSGAAGSIDFTIGEVVINTGTNGTNDITQGFHQTNWNFLSLDDFVPDYSVAIFPNPVQNILNIQTENFEGVSYKMYDAAGRIVMEDVLTSNSTVLQVERLAPGKYSITLSKNSNKLKTFKLVKHT